MLATEIMGEKGNLQIITLSVVLFHTGPPTALGALHENIHLLHYPCGFLQHMLSQIGSNETLKF